MSKARLPIRPRLKKPALRIADILRWADAFHAKHGRWPNMLDGVVEGTADQTWAAADQALRGGNRGLPGGSSLAKLLLKCRGRRHRHLPPDLSIEQILGWADAHHKRTGEWPRGHSTEQVPKAPKGMTWVAIDIALSRGKRGLTGGLSLAKLLEQHRGVRNRMDLPDLTVKEILAWADDHRNRMGNWPKYLDGIIAAAPQETWNAVDTALSKGKRGLPGGDSLSRLLARRRGARNKAALPLLNESTICRWAESHRNRTGTWPVVKSGPVFDAPGESWSGINAALERGMRGLPGGDSLARLLAKVFRKRNPVETPSLSYDSIRAWAETHHTRTGSWPKNTSGPIEGTSGETWGGVENALRKGRRGLPGGTTLMQFIRDNCQPRE